MKILVTGGCGFIGSHLVDRLIDAGHEVVVFDDLSGGFTDNLNSEATFCQADCRNQEEMDWLFKIEEPEIVFHLSANAAENKAQFSPIDITTRNYNTFLSVLVAGLNHGMKRIVVTSSNAVYGDIKSPFKETDEPHPEDLYGLSKLQMERTLKILSRVHNFEYAIARPHNVYGPRQSMADPYRNVIMIWMNKLLHGEPYTIYGDGSMKRCYTYIDDLVDGLFKLGFEDVNGEIFNLGADEPISLKQLSDTIQEVTGGAIPPQYLPARPQEVKDAIPDHEKAKRVLDYKTKTDLITGILKTWEWAKAKGPVEPVYTDFEIDSPKIPANWRK